MNIEKMKTYIFYVTILTPIILSLNLISNIEEKYLLGLMLSMYSIYNAEKISFTKQMFQEKDFETKITTFLSEINHLNKLRFICNMTTIILIVIYSFDNNMKMIFIGFIPVLFQYLSSIMLRNNLNKVVL